MPSITNPYPRPKPIKPEPGWEDIIEDDGGDTAFDYDGIHPHDVKRRPHTSRWGVFHTPSDLRCGREDDEDYSADYEDYSDFGSDEWTIERNDHDDDLDHYYDQVDDKFYPTEQDRVDAHPPKTDAELVEDAKWMDELPPVNSLRWKTIRAAWARLAMAARPYKGVYKHCEECGGDMFFWTCSECGELTCQTDDLWQRFAGLA